MKPLFRVCIFLIPVLFIYSSSLAQEADWTLQRAVQYALDHNISIQQNELNRRLEQLTLQQSRLAQLPNVNLSTGYGRSFGRSIDPTTNQFVEGSSYDFLSLSGSADVLLFGWFQRRNRISQSKFNLRAAGKELEQLQNDVSLNVATGYLRILLAGEQVKINEQQVALSKEQLGQTQSFANAGRVPELNVAQLEAQLASDSSNLISALTEYNAAILDIKALLNLDFDTPFEPVVVQSIEADFANAFISPDEIYLAAVQRMPVISGARLRLDAARKGHAAAVGGLYPQLALSVQAGTNYSTLNKDYTITGTTVSPVAGSYAYDSAGNSIYQIYQATPVFTTNTLPLGKQLDNNFRQTVSIGINIPIFNAWQAQTAARQAKINMLTQQLNVDQAELRLKQDVYKAHNDARNALQKYYAAERAANAAKRAHEFARKRNELGLTNTVEYLVIQNNMYRAEANMASAKYDLIFKLKVIDFYLGKELKL
ncbi:MAG TPA: TolC family protein [Flavipsychrobacter sp.]